METEANIEDAECIRVSYLQFIVDFDTVCLRLGKKVTANKIDVDEILKMIKCAKRNIKRSELLQPINCPDLELFLKETMILDENRFGWIFGELSFSTKNEIQLHKREKVVTFAMQKIPVKVQVDTVADAFFLYQFSARFGTAMIFKSENYPGFLFFFYDNHLERINRKEKPSHMCLKKSMFESEADIGYNSEISDTCDVCKVLQPKNVKVTYLDDLTFASAIKQKIQLCK